MRRCVLLLTLLSYACGYGREPAAPAATAPAKPAVLVEVISDPAAVEAARQRGAQADGKYLDEYFARFKEGTLADYDLPRRFRGRTEPRARLLAIRDDAKRDPRERGRAAQLLCELDDPSCWDGLRRLLSSSPGSAEAGLDALHRVVEIKEPPADILTLVSTHVRGATESVRVAAVRVCRAVEVPGAAPHLMRILSGQVSGRRADAAGVLAKYAPSVEAVKHTASLLGSDESENLSAMLALNDFAAASDPAVSKAAIDALTAHAARPGATDDDRSLAIDAMARFGSPDAITALRAAAAAKSNHAYPIYALGGLVRLGDPGALEKLRALMARNDTRYTAVSALYAAAGPRPEPAMLKLLVEAMPKETAEDQMRVAWLVKGRRAEEAAMRLAEIGVIASMPTPEVVAVARHQREELSSNEPWLLSDLLERNGSLLYFDTETGVIPVNHDTLLLELAGISRGQFTPAAAIEEFKDPKNDESPYLVHFVHRDKLYRVTAENLGDWYDVPSVLTAANRALADAGVAERFIALHTGDQMTSVLFANPAAAQTAAAELLIVLEDDPDRGRKDGKAFEALAIEELKKRK